MGVKGSGRRPLPSAVKNLRGNPGKRPVNKREPKPEMGTPAMPPGLCAFAKQIWNEKVKEIEAMGALAKIDGDQLGAYCTAMAHAAAAEQDIQENGLTYEEAQFDKRGKHVGDRRRNNPAVQLWNDATKIAKSLAAEFGMTPSSRSRLKIEKPAEVDPFDVMIERKMASASKPSVN